MLSSSISNLWRRLLISRHAFSVSVEVILAARHNFLLQTYINLDCSFFGFWNNFSGAMGASAFSTYVISKVIKGGHLDRLKRRDATGALLWDFEEASGPMSVTPRRLQNMRPAAGGTLS